MKTMLIVMVLSGLSTAASIPNQKTQQGFLIKSELVYTANGEEIKSNREFILPQNNKSWNTLVDPKNGVAVLGRMVKADQKSIHLEYMIVDTKKPNAIISTPSIGALLGENAEISTKGDTEQFTIKLLASRTDFTSEKSSEK